MKIRTDFVTNSSSSSFVFALKGEITQEQKLAIADCILKKMFAKKLFESGATDDDIQAVAERYEGLFSNTLNEQEKIKQALADGKDIYYGHHIYRWCAGDSGCVFQEIWSILEETSEIDTLIDDVYSWYNDEEE